MGSRWIVRIAVAVLIAGLCALVYLGATELTQPFSEVGSVVGS
jgi:hypothetical protein